MVRTTREQRVALKDAYDRWAEAGTYRQFRKTVQATFAMDHAVVVPWCGIWLCIETDGYTHS